MAEESWTPEYSAWRHGGWYVTNVRHPSGAVGCVSRNYADRKWRIVCDPRPFDEAPTFRSRDEAARAEQELAQSVHTWADGFGNWHARVTEKGGGDVKLATRLAYLAILAELTQREAPGWAPDGLMLEVVAVVASVPLGQTGPALDTTTEFVEKWPTD